MRRLLLCCLLLCGCWSTPKRDPFKDELEAVHRDYGGRRELLHSTHPESPASAKLWADFRRDMRRAVREVYRKHNRPLPVGMPAD